MECSDLWDIVLAQDMYEYAKKQQELNFNKEFEKAMANIRRAASNGEYMVVFDDILSFGVKLKLLDYKYLCQDCNGQTVVYFKK